MDVKLRFKYVLKRVNHTNVKEWFHYEKHWKLQQFSKEGGQWIDIPDVYFVEDENGVAKEVSYEEYLKVMKK